MQVTSTIWVGAPDAILVTNMFQVVFNTWNSTTETTAQTKDIKIAHCLNYLDLFLRDETYQTSLYKSIGHYEQLTLFHLEVQRCEYTLDRQQFFLHKIEEITTEKDKMKVDVDMRASFIYKQYIFTGKIPTESISQSVSISGSIISSTQPPRAILPCFAVKNPDDSQLMLFTVNSNPCNILGDTNYLNVAISTKLCKIPLDDKICSGKKVLGVVVVPHCNTVVKGVQPVDSVNEITVIIFIDETFT